MSFEVERPIINSPYEEPRRHWYIQEGEDPQLLEGRRSSFVFRPQDNSDPWDVDDGSLSPQPNYRNAYALTYVNLLRDRLTEWRRQGYPGATGTTLELIRWWRREGRHFRIFFAQLEAAETIAFLHEARADFLQGIDIPRDNPGADKRPFERYACKMATGAGKTTVMGMLAAWSILNKIADRGNPTYSDLVLVICPNITIRDRLRELDPEAGAASIYRKNDLVPSALMPDLVRGRVIITNWHVLEPQDMGRVGEDGARVVKAGIPEDRTEEIHIGEKTTTARGTRYFTLADYTRLVGSGVFFVLSEKHDGAGRLQSAVVSFRRYVESDKALITRVLGRTIGAKKNILVFNDEAHHAYRIHQDEKESDEEALLGTAEADEIFAQEATVWVEGLDKLQKERGINFCLDLSATPYYLARAGKDTGRPFPWVVSDFGLIDAIESGLVKIPQLAVTDATGEQRAQYYNVWKWVTEQLGPHERGSPEAILRYAAHPIALLAGDWRKELKRWDEQREDERPPVFIVVCKDIRLAKVVYEWIAENRCPPGIPTFNVDELRNTDGTLNTIRVDTKVIAESDTEGAKSDENRWMRFTLDTIGKVSWPADTQGRPVYPAGFEELAAKLERPLDPPGRAVRCIVSVGMLTEGWDANTVTHIIGLRPFMSQLLCEQVVGRGLRRASYDVDENGLFAEEIAHVLGVPFSIVPFKASGQPVVKPPARYHVHALESRAEYEIRFPHVEGYTQAIRSRVTVDWQHAPKIQLKPEDYPTQVEMGGMVVTAGGEYVGGAIGEHRLLTIDQYRAATRLQSGIFQLARDITRTYCQHRPDSVPAHVLFPQIQVIANKYVHESVHVPPTADRRDVFLPIYYKRVLEILSEAIQPDTAAGEAPEIPRYQSLRPEGTTADVDFWTSRDVRQVKRSHVNYVVADSGWEAQAIHYIDNHASVAGFVKNSGLGFTIPYLNEGVTHDFQPDFIIRLNGDGERYLVLETKGFDELAELKAAAAQRWVDAVNADGTKGRWRFAMARSVADVSYLLSASAANASES